jgi:hypothetical protein
MAIRGVRRALGFCTACWCVALTPQAARAQTGPSPCAPAHIRLAAPLPDAWAARVGSLCEQLSRRGDLDPSAELEISPGEHGGLALHAQLSDGRSALRYVDSPDALALTAEALLVLPAPPIAAPQQPTAASAPVAAPDPHAASPALPSDPGFRKPVNSLLHLAIQLSVIGHVGGTPAYVGGGFAAHFALRFRAVFLEVAPRWEAQQASLQMRLNDFEMHSLGVGVLLGMRVWDTVDALAEIGVGALTLSQSQSYRPVAAEVGGTLIGAEFGAFARLLGADTSLRWAVAADFSLAPGRFSHEVRIRDIFPPLPSFAFGFDFGVRWESR